MGKEEMAVKHTLTTLPMNNDVLSEEFLGVSVDDIEEIIYNNIVEEPIKTTGPIKNGKDRFKNVLLELEKLKKKLGGTPTFRGKTPTMDDKDSDQTFFGVPMSAVKDWLRMTLKNEWRPQFFWKKLSALFGVTKYGMSQYEEAHIRIQRFGMMIENKDRFIHILESKDEARYGELSKITGLAWHPGKNSAGVEKMYMEFTELFLTDYFEDAKSKGEDALIGYFHAFQGVCFEDRVRRFEEYTQIHPIADLTSESHDEIADWSTNNSAEEVFMKEVVILAMKNQGAPPTPTELLDYLQDKGIFNMEFMTSEGIKSKPTEDQFMKWAQEQVEMCILKEEPTNEVGSP